VKNDESRRSVEGEREFYLFGLIPKKHTVYVDEELSKRGLKKIKNLKTSTFMTNMQRFKSIISLGLFIPRSYRVSAFGPIK